MSSQTTRQRRATNRRGRAVRAAGTALTVLAALPVAAACGSGSDEASVDAARSSAYASLTSSSQASASSAASRPPIPSAADLDTQIKRALDPNLPDSERTALIQDGQAFSDAIPDLYKALHDNPNAVYGVTDPVFDNHDGTLTATMKLDKAGTGENVRTSIVHFIDIDGMWKISRNDLCGILRSADYKTTACG